MEFRNCDGVGRKENALGQSQAPAQSINPFKIALIFARRLVGQPFIHKENQRLAFDRVVFLAQRPLSFARQAGRLEKETHPFKNFHAIERGEVGWGFEQVLDPFGQFLQALVHLFGLLWRDGAALERVENLFVLLDDRNSGPNLRRVLS